MKRNEKRRGEERRGKEECSRFGFDPKSSDVTGRYAPIDTTGTRRKKKKKKKEEEERKKRKKEEKEKERKCSRFGFDPKSSGVKGRDAPIDTTGT